MSLTRNQEGLRLTPGRPEVRHFIDTLRTEHGIDASFLERILGSARFEPTVVRLLDPERAQDGLEFLEFAVREARARDRAGEVHRRRRVRVRTDEPTRVRPPRLGGVTPVGREEGVVAYATILLQRI